MRPVPLFLAALSSSLRGRLQGGGGRRRRTARLFSGSRDGEDLFLKGVGRREVLRLGRSVVGFGAVCGVGDGSLCFPRRVEAAVSESDLSFEWATADSVSGVPTKNVAKRISSTYYGVEFVTYLSRFLLNFDESSAAWWRNQLESVPPSYDGKRRLEVLDERFAASARGVGPGGFTVTSACEF